VAGGRRSTHPMVGLLLSLSLDSSDGRLASLITIWLRLGAHSVRALFFPPSIPGMQSQIVCHACRTVLLYPRGASSVCCAVCQAITTVPPPGTYWMLGFPFRLLAPLGLGRGNNRP